MDRRSRFSPDPVLQSFRGRAASQPPRSSQQADSLLYAFHDSSNPQQNPPTTQSNVRWPSVNRIGRSPVPPRAPPLRSASFSASGQPEAEFWPIQGSGFGSTFEEDDEESIGPWENGQPRSWQSAEHHFRSSGPMAARSRSLVGALTNPLPVGHSVLTTGGLSGSYDWRDKSALHNSIDQRLLNGYPSRTNGSRSQSLQSAASMPVGLAHRVNQAELSNNSPFVRGLHQHAANDEYANSNDWTRMSTMREEDTGSGATSRRHSVSVVQPRARGVGFAAGGPMMVDDSLSRIPNNRSIFSDEELAGDFSRLQMSNGQSDFPPPTSFPYSVPRISQSPSRSRFGSTFGNGQNPLDGHNANGAGEGRQLRSENFEHHMNQAFLHHDSQRRSLSPLRTSVSRDPSPSRNGLPSPISAHPQRSEPATPGAADSGQGIPIEELPPSAQVVILEFKLNRKEVFYCDPAIPVKVGDMLIVEGDRGKDIGQVLKANVDRTWLMSQRRGSDTSVLNLSQKAKKVYAIAGPQEAQDLNKKEEDELKALQLCQSKVRQKKLPMQVVDCEFQWDRRKLTFYFIAETRIDFRDLVRELFRLYKTRIWMSCVSGPLAGTGSGNITY